MNRTVFWTPLATMAPGPAWQRAAPTSPPTSAWDEEVGSPSHHVRRFQSVAPVKAAMMTWLLTAPGVTMPLPTVAATASPRI